MEKCHFVYINVIYTYRNKYIYFVQNIFVPFPITTEVLEESAISSSFILHIFNSVMILIYTEFYPVHIIAVTLTVTS